MNTLRKYVNVSVNSIVGELGILFYIFAICIRLKSTEIPNYQTILSDTISFASFITCLMFIGLAYLPTQMHSSRFKEAVGKLKTSISLMNQILITISIYFSLSIICLFSLAFSKIDIINIPLTALWGSLFITGAVEVSVMLIELFRIIIYMIQESQVSSKMIKKSKKVEDK